MSSSTRPWLAQSWRPILMVATVYIYFLIFSQFGFLHRVTEVVGEDFQDWVLGVMGLAGISGALFAGFAYRAESIRLSMGSGFLGSALSAVLVAASDSTFWFLTAAALSGFSLGLLTVVVVGFLNDFCSKKRVGLLCGIGTGIAYFVSNLPVVFEASPSDHCWVGAVVAVVGMILLATSPLPEMMQTPTETVHPSSGGRRRLVILVVAFLVLIWMDSAAFSHIQVTPALKAASWSGAGNLWLIGIVHGVAAIAGGSWIDRGGLRWVVFTALACLGLGFTLLTGEDLAILPALLYAVGVSFYSTGLVAFALTERTGVRAVVAAGLVYSIAGWLGSAMGIGMAQHFGGVPPVAWGISAVLLLPVGWVRPSGRSG